ncbi:hypothetical protein AB1L30_23210 [Bremerella sp. JC817]|uniref:hypothetical protein n=1 Tax=Bremerella sp. JC817 TaxID=3231756 RepID=UPI00345A9121
MIKAPRLLLLSGLAMAAIASVTLIAMATNNAVQQAERNRIMLDCRNAMIFVESYRFRHAHFPPYCIGTSSCGDRIGWQMEMAASIEPKGGPASDILDSIASQQEVDCQRFSDLVEDAMLGTTSEDSRMTFIGVWPTDDHRPSRNINRMTLIGSSSLSSKWYLADDLKEFQRLTKGSVVGDMSPDGILAVFADGEMWWLSEYTPTRVLVEHTGAEESLPNREITLKQYHVND